MRQKPVYLACFLLHFLLIVTVCSRETLWLIARGLTIFPSSFKSYAPIAGTEVATVTGQNLATLNPLQRAFATYLHIAGIERGYGYFAPNVPAGQSSERPVPQYPFPRPGQYSTLPWAIFVRFFPFPKAAAV